METLVLFAKAPLAGATKTRLAKERGPRGERDAVVLAGGFLLDIAELCARWRAEKVAVDQNRRVALYASPDVDDPVIAEAARRAGARLELQQGADLGERLRHAFDAEYERGARAVCVVGSDSPTLPLHLVDEAFRALVWERVVIGPTFDGGYWLIGAQRPAPDLFTGIPWSTSSVAQQTVALLKKSGVDPALLSFWYDVDDGADLDRLVWHAQALRQRAPAALASTWRALQQLGLVDDKLSAAAAGAKAP